MGSRLALGVLLLAAACARTTMDSSVRDAHGSLDTTVLYTHLTSISEARTRAALETLHRQLHGR